jgi:alkylated DNA repair dioxygenase AlkB
MIPDLIRGANLRLTNTRTILFIEIVIRRANSLAGTATKLLVENPGPSTIKLQTFTSTKFFVQVVPWRTIYRTNTYTVCRVEDVTSWASLYSTHASTILLTPFPWPNTMLPLAHTLALVLVPG